MNDNSIVSLKKGIQLVFESALYEFNDNSYHNAVELMKIYFGISEMMFKYCPEKLTTEEINDIRQFISVRYCAICEIMRIKYEGE